MNQWTPQEIEDHLRYIADFATWLESTGEYVDQPGASWAAMGVKPGQNSRPRSSSPRVLERTYVVPVGGTSHGRESRRSTRSRCLATGPAATSERDHPPVRVACSMQHPETGEFRRPPQSA